MEKSFLEQAIIQRAANRLDDDMRNFAKRIESCPIMKNLSIVIDGEHIRFMNHSGQVPNVFFNSFQTQKAESLTNINAIKEKLIDEYKKEETDKILKGLESISYLYNQS